jgi:hypothetical protein
MSAITDVYNQLKAQIKSVLPNHQLLANPYRTADNPELLLRQGYGIQIGQGGNNRLSVYSLSQKRQFSIVITRQAYATQSDQGAKAVTEKQIIEDQLLVLNAIEKDPTLGGLVLRAEYASDSGVSFVSTDKDNFLELTTAVSVIYVDAVQ